jgi:hypothetical protein
VGREDFEGEIQKLEKDDAWIKIAENDEQD